MAREEVDLSRRSFLRGNALTGEGRERHRRDTGRLGPAIPWLDSITGKETCGDCAQPCVSSCSRRVISFHPDAHPFSATPYLDFSATGCYFCGDCVDACPQLDAPVAIRATIIGKVELDITSCHAWNGVFCISCIGHCDADALSMNAKRQLLVNETACNGCGNCLSPCPGQALTIKSAQDV